LSGIEIKFTLSIRQEFAPMVQ